jgi:hypothetical protein
MASTRGASDEWTTVATQRVSRWSVWLAAFASVAIVTAIVAEGELGLFDPPASVNLRVGLAPGVAWLGAGLVAWGLRPVRPTGRLMTAVGIAYFAPSVLVLVCEPLPRTGGAGAADPGGARVRGARTRPADLSAAVGRRHDAAVLARAGVPTGMLFARSLAGGIGHAPGEHTDPEAIADGIAVLRAATRQLGNS